MALINRKPRPLTRDSASLRDDQLFIIACDDTYAPKQYFGFFRVPRVRVYVVATQDGGSAAEHVLARIQQFEYEEDDELWMLLDTDHYTQGAHVRSFVQAVADARRRGVHVAVSKPCFELWLLLHHVAENEVSALADASAVEQALRTTLGQYNKTRLREQDYPVSSVVEACKRAEKLDRGSGGGDIPANNVSRVYLVWKAILSKALPSQLTVELREMLPK